jgi:transglutaminase-like putative cysteine protease
MPHRVCAVLFICLLLLCGQALTRDTGTDPAVVVDRFIQHYVVETDGSYQLSVDHAKTIVEQRALRTHGQYTISYNRTLDEVLSLEAWTVKPDGRRVPVQPGQVQDQQEAAAAPGEAPMFEDTRLKVVVFPEAAMGDQLAVRYVVRRKAALFPGHFEDLSSSPFYLNKNFVLIYDMPAAMPLHADAVGFVAVPGESPPGRRRYQWRYVNGDNERLEAGSVSYFDYGKRLAVSTFADYADFARAFRAGTAAAAGKTPTSPAIAALARRLIAGVPDARARALALSDWVRHNIRYVGVYVGPGGVVAHPPAPVLENRYGDCKDHAGLLEALLAAAGIDSTSALVNSGNAYLLPEAPTLGVFNHMITYVPSLGLYLDPTAESVGAGYLSAGILGKPVLLLKTGAFAMTPILQPERNRSSTWFDIRRDGRSSFKLSKLASGALAEPWRTALRDARQAEREAFAQRMLQGLGQKSRGVFDAEGAARAGAGQDGDEYRMSFSGTSDGFLDLPGPSALATTYDLWSGLAEAVFNLSQEAERRQDFVCPAIDQEDETGFRLPKGVRILAMPRPLSLMDGGIYYRASYTRRGNEVLVKRRLTFRHGRATCTPGDFRAMQPALERIIRDLRAQIVVAGS